MNLFDSDTKSINESSFDDVLIGNHPYRITQAKLSAKEGRATGLSVSLEHLEKKSRHSIYLPIGDEGVAGRIAKSTSKAIWDATKLTGAVGPDRLPNYTDKLIWIDAYESGTRENG